MLEPAKLRTREQLKELTQAAQEEGRNVVFTNGCFDLLHPGHVVYLQQAAELGDELILALNSDSSVRRLKGPTRPILNEKERALALDGLESITWIVIFDELRVTNLLNELKPDIWTKGGDYTIDTLDRSERQAAEANGTQIVLIPPVEGLSTTNILERIDDLREADSGGD